MRRLVFLSVVAAAVLASGGTALAATLACNGGRCVGGDGPDTMYGSGGRYEIYSLKGGDLVRANAGGDFLVGGMVTDGGLSALCVACDADPATCGAARRATIGPSNESRCAVTGRLVRWTTRRDGRSSDG